MARLIDANALKEIFDNRYDDAFMQVHVRANRAWWEGYCGGVNWARNTLADTNAVDAVEVVHGKWLDVFTGFNFFAATCSVCHKRSDLPPIAVAKYCPRCGARMDGDSQ